MSGSWSRSLLAALAAVALVVALFACSPDPSPSDPAVSPTPTAAPLELAYQYGGHDFWERVRWDALAADLGVTMSAFRHSVDQRSTNAPVVPFLWAGDARFEASDGGRFKWVGQVIVTVLYNKSADFFYQDRDDVRRERGERRPAPAGWWSEGTVATEYDTERRVRARATYLVYHENLYLDVDWVGGPDDYGEWDEGEAIATVEEMARALLDEVVRQIPCEPLVDGAATTHCDRQ